MHQTKKGEQWSFGMKAHTGADAKTDIAYSLAATAANASDVNRTHKLLHGEEKHVHADAGYQGSGRLSELKDCPAEFVIARRRSTYKGLDKTDPRLQLIEKAEHAKASIRSNEPPRILRRLQLLRRWSHEEIIEVLT